MGAMLTLHAAMAEAGRAFAELICPTGTADSEQTITRDPTAFYGCAYFDGSQKGFVAAIAFWLYKQATLGKTAVPARVVDAKTVNTMTVDQSIGLYLGCIVSTIPL